MSFTTKVFSDVQPLLKTIKEHPFNARLADGTLEKEKFIYYMQQDSLYLIDFGRAFALMAGRFTAEQDISLFLNFSELALIAERSLHLHYFNEFSVPAITQKGPACLMYTSYLVERAATANLYEAMAAVLPCLWVYQQVGLDIFKRNKPGNPYDKWIETYAGEEFGAEVEKAVKFTDALASQCGPTELQRMHDAFMTATRLEYYFWDDAEHCRKWIC